MRTRKAINRSLPVKNQVETYPQVEPRPSSFSKHLRRWESGSGLHKVLAGMCWQQRLALASPWTLNVSRGRAYVFDRWACRRLPCHAGTIFLTHPPSATLEMGSVRTPARFIRPPEKRLEKVSKPRQLVLNWRAADGGQLTFAIKTRVFIRTLCDLAARWCLILADSRISLVRSTAGGANSLVKSRTLSSKEQAAQAFKCTRWGIPELAVEST